MQSNNTPSNTASGSSSNTGSTTGSGNNYTANANTNNASNNNNGGNSGNSNNNGHHYNGNRQRHYNNHNNHHNNNHHGQHSQQGGNPGYATYQWPAQAYPQNYVQYVSPVQGYGFYPPQPQNYYSVQQAYIPPTGIPQQQNASGSSIPPIASPPATTGKPHIPSTPVKISIKNANGEAVTFPKTAGHGKSPSVSFSTSASTSPVVAAGKMASPVLNKTAATLATASPVAANASVTPAAPVAPAAPKAAAMDFMAAIRAKAAAAAAAQKKEEPKAEEIKETPKEEEKKEEVAAEAPKAEVAAVSEPESKPEPKVETESKEEIQKEEPKEESKEESKEDQKETAKEEIKETSQEESIEESKKESEDIAKEESKPETEAPVEAEAEKDAETTKEATSADAQEEQEESKPEEVDAITISEVFDRIEAAKPVPSDFEYPEGIKASVLRDSGKKKIKYEPPFLLQFADKMSFPIDEKWAQLIASKIIIPVGGSNGSRGKDNKGDRSSSGFGKSFGGKGQFSGSVGNLRNQGQRNEMDSRNGSRGGSKRGGMGGREKSKKDRNSSKKGRRGDGPSSESAAPDVPALPPVEVKPLEATAGRWVPRSLRKTEKPKVYAPDGVTVILDEEDVAAKIKSLLNKLTLDNMTDISKEIIDIANQSRFETDGKTLQQVIELIFAKACDEIHWSQVYANLCVILVKTISPEIRLEGVAMGDLTPEQYVYNITRRFLILRCQVEYEKGWIDSLPTDENGEIKEVELMSDEYYAQAATKRRGLGLARFIAELFVLSLLGEKIITRCIYDLVKTEVPTEADVETLDKLLRTAGGILESKETGKNSLNICFSKFTPWLESDKVLQKVKFKLQDLIDLRKQGWSTGQDKGPKTIAEIHEADRRKQLEAQREAQSKRKFGGDSRQNSSRGNSKWGNESVSSSDISSMGQIRNASERSSGPMGNLNKSKSIRQSLQKNQNSQASSQSFTQVTSTSNRASSTSLSAVQNSSAVSLSREPSKRSDSSKKNMFLHLGSEDEDEDDEEEEATEEPEQTAETEVEAEAEAEETKETAEVEAEKEENPEEESKVEDESIEN